jgi:hypothetical protein
MPTRRQFLQTLAVLPPALSCGHGWAANPASDPSRLALIIGNSSYRDAPLVNPTNDARAVTGLFTLAGFTVDSRLNATRADMIGAIEKFGAAVKRAETKLVVFYYAGHGAQLDWRNYLLPVDAVVQKQEDMKQRCVDLGLLLGQLNAAKDKTFIVILDACRNNPFGKSYRPEQKGLSQFDAPVGSLLAYATSPGNVASDGEGQNGLYTENLVRELSKPATRIEDALKRVRLNVRLASSGAQIPWETTSLESDVFILNDGQKKLTEAEQEKLLEADLGEWARIKSSKKADDWIAYLRTFPNGRFAEIAQTRLARLLAEKEKAAAASLAAAAPPPAPAVPPAAAAVLAQAAKPAAAPSAAPAPVGATAPTPAVAAAPAPPKPVIEIAAGNKVPQVLQTSVHPNSAGRYPLGRKFSVGDEGAFRITDLLTGNETWKGTLAVTRVDEDTDRVELNNGEWVMDLMGNVLSSPGASSDVPRQFAPGELQVGKKWAAGWTTEHQRWGKLVYDLNLRIAAFEKVRVMAGEFDAFRIEGEGWITNVGTRLERRFWIVPGLNFAVKSEQKDLARNGRYYLTNSIELVSLRQQTIDTKCATPAGGLHRTLVIKSSCA